MRLRTQGVLGIGAMAAVAVVLLFAVVFPHLQRSFSGIERADVRRNVERVGNALATELSTLETVSHAWASWDDTVGFVLGREPQHVDENLFPETFTSLHIDFTAFFDSSGRLIHAQGFDLVEGSPAAVPEAELAGADSVVVRDRATDDTSSRAGVLAFSDELALVAVHPILSSLHEPPACGTLVIGRTLTASEVERLASQVRLPILFRSLNDPRDDPDAVAALIRGDPRTLEPAVVPLSEETVAGFTVLRDILGAPLVVLGVELPRDAYRTGLAASRYLTAALLSAVAVLGGGFLYFLDARVLSRTARLSRNVARIAHAQDSSARVAAEGKDELGGLAANINGMLSSIEESRGALERSERRYHSLFESSRDPIYITTEDGRSVDANSALVGLSGYAKDELMAMTAGELHARPQDREAFRAAIAEKRFVTSYPRLSGKRTVRSFGAR
ncbi:MAG: CHASE4 domain-containing protein [Candidatus Bipolaricaulis sp.]|nr:CHASE4 domain-containing protein [Candidatus Bipolaricaulis sp.]